MSDTSKRIIFTNAEGGLSVVVPAPDCPLTMFQLAEQVVPAGREWSLVNADTVPSDREFRNAWRKDGATVRVDLPAAKEIVRDRVRAEREPLLASLDVSALRAQEQGDAVKLAEIVAQKQALRDAPASTRISDAQSVKDLKGLGIKDLI